jgi:hypothetical protein
MHRERLGWAAWALLFFIWLPLESGSLTVVVLLAAPLAAALGWRVARWSRGLGGAALGGLSAGALLGPLTVGLIVFKLGVHNHGASAADFTLEQAARLLRQTPIWSAAGLLLAVGGTLLGRALRPPPPRRLDET